MATKVESAICVSAIPNVELMVGCSEVKKVQNFGEANVISKQCRMRLDQHPSTSLRYSLSLSASLKSTASNLQILAAHHGARKV